MILLATIQLTAFGQAKHLDTSQFIIKQSLKCFAEQKSLKIIIAAKDTINLELEKKVARLTFLSDTCAKTNTILTNNNKALKNDNTTLKTYLKLLGGIGLVELLVIILK